MRVIFANAFELPQIFRNDNVKFVIIWEEQFHKLSFEAVQPSVWKFIMALFRSNLFTWSAFHLKLINILDVSNIKLLWNINGKKVLLIFFDLNMFIYNYHPTKCYYLSLVTGLITRSFQFLFDEILNIAITDMKGNKKPFFIS